MENIIAFPSLSSKDPCVTKKGEEKVPLELEPVLLCLEGVGCVVGGFSNLVVCEIKAKSGRNDSTVERD